MSVRAKNCLKAENIFYIGDLIQKTEFDLRKIPNLGDKTFKEIKEALELRGLQLKPRVDRGEELQ